MTSTDFCRTRGILSHGRKKNGEDHHTHCGRPSSNPRKRAVLSLLLPQGCLFKGNKEMGVGGGGLKNLCSCEGRLCIFHLLLLLF